MEDLKSIDKPFNPKIHYGYRTHCVIEIILAVRYKSDVKMLANLGVTREVGMMG
jgi:hypothetical protein